MIENENEGIIRIILDHFPSTQAIYLFGSYSTDDEWPDSDVDIALLLPPQQAKATSLPAQSDMRSGLETLLKKEVDLINLRRVSTVLQKEIIAADRLIHCADEYAAAEFEMLTLSYYQRLNEERAEIVADALATGRIIG